MDEARETLRYRADTIFKTKEELEIEQKYRDQFAVKLNSQANLIAQQVEAPPRDSDPQELFLAQEMSTTVNPYRKFPGPR